MIELVFAYAAVALLTVGALAVHERHASGYVTMDEAFLFVIMGCVWPFAWVVVVFAGLARIVFLAANFTLKGSK